MSSRDPFVVDKARRERLRDEVYDVRLKLWEAKEAHDAAAALAALERLYKLTEQIPDAQVLFVGELSENAPSFVLPPACRQLLARHSGRCAGCEGPIKRGDIIYWEPHERATFCVACGGIPGLAPQPDGR